jgi:protein-disulfide isomerase
MHRHLFVILILATLVGAQQKTATPHAKPDTAPKTHATANLPSEDAVNAFMQEMFGYDPAFSWNVISIKPAKAEGLAEVTIQVSNSQGQQNTKLYVTPDGQHAVLGEIIPFGAHPFLAAHQDLEKGINGPSRGPANAPVTIVEFSDLQCPHCKEAQPVIDKLLSEETNVHFVFQNFPLPSHDWAANAAAYADCVGRSSNDAFWKFVQATYEAQAEITAANADEKLMGLADKAGVKGSDVAACAAKPDTTARVDHSVALGRSVDVNATPTIFINGRKVSGISGIPPDVLKNLVEFAPKQGK